MHTQPNRPLARFPRPPRKREAQQGIVLLVVLMLILMATSTAVWALQSTAFEQRASTSVLEMSLSRAHSDCAAMAGITLEELNMKTGNLSPRWLAGAEKKDSYANKYKWPFASAGASGTVSSETPPSAIYWCGNQMSRDSRELHMLHESYVYSSGGGGGGVGGGVVGPTGQGSAYSAGRSLVVITGFGDIKPLGKADSDEARLIYEVDTQARAFFDRTN